eukprot:9863341-Karenia_brevis.AAC.1
MDAPIQEEIRDEKMAQEVKDNQNEVPFIWPKEYNGHIEPGERMRVFDNFSEMKAKWDELPISELQYDYEMLAFVKSVKHGDGYGCVVGR